METFVWDQHFITGLPDVDQQHHGLVDLFNQLSATLIEGGGIEPALLQQTFGQLVDYANFHFSDEEALMQRCGIDSRHLQMHCELHASFMQQVSSMWQSRALLHNPSETFVGFLIAWLGLHILGVDQSMARQLALLAQGRSAAQAYQSESTNQDNRTAALLHAVEQLHRVLGRLNQELTVASSQLEQRVAQRTAELAEANRQLEIYSHTDGLMQIANRKYFDQSLQREWLRGAREQQPLGLLMIDVDHFKRYNDHYGHQAGDACLRALARTIQAALARPGDLLARYGGEELAVLLPNTGTQGALHVAEVVRSAVAALALAHADSPVAGVVTVSVGSASRRPGANSSAAMLVACADRALYAAKAAGRNRICAA